jgi:hypothetical protein
MRRREGTRAQGVSGGMGRPPTRSSQCRLPDNMISDRDPIDPDIVGAECDVHECSPTVRLHVVAEVRHFEGECRQCHLGPAFDVRTDTGESTKSFCLTTTPPRPGRQESAELSTLPSHFLRYRAEGCGVNSGGWSRAVPHHRRLRRHQMDLLSRHQPDGPPRGGQGSRSCGLATPVDPVAHPFAWRSTPLTANAVARNRC